MAGRMCQVTGLPDPTILTDSAILLGDPPQDFRKQIAPNSLENKTWKSKVPKARSNLSKTCQGILENVTTDVEQFRTPIPHVT